MSLRPLKIREVLVLTPIIIGVTWLVIPHEGDGPRARDRFLCAQNLQHISLAFIQYAGDNDHRFPDLTNPQWRQTLTPYIKSTAYFHCPTVGGHKNVATSDYWFNARVSRVKQEDFTSLEQTFLLGDGETHGDSHVALSSLPERWQHDPQSPSWRHLGGANYAFADGHVRGLSPRQNTTQKPDADGETTFLVR